MFNTNEIDSTTDQLVNSNELQELLQKALERVKYFFDIDLDIISEWVKTYQKCLNLITEQKQKNLDTQMIQDISSTLQKLISNIEIIKTEGMLLVGNFKPWMSGVGMINFPYGYTIYGNITFGILNGKGVIEKNEKKMRLIGTFNQNKLQGNGTIIYQNQYQINGLFDNGKLTSGPIQIKLLDGSQKEIQIELNINSNQMELSNQQQLRENIIFSNLEYNRPDNIKYKAPQFLLGQHKQNSSTLHQNEILLQEYENGILKNGQGQVEKDNNIVLKGKFTNGALFGFGSFTDKNNNLLLEGEFQQNIMTIGNKYYLETKYLHENGQFNDQQQLSGNGRRYFDTLNLLKEEGQFENGQLHGEGIRYQINDIQQNVIEEKGHFQNGILLSGTKFYQSGLIKEKGIFNQKGLEGEGERRYFNGYIQEYGIFQNGQLHSLDDKSGRVNDNGVFIEIGYFQNGKLEKEGERYYPNGRKKEFGLFSQGVLNGSGKKYYDNEDNTLEEEGVFQNGQLHSKIDISKQYYQNGSLRCYGLFQNGLLKTIDGALYFNEYEMKGVFHNGQVSGSMRIFNSQTNKEHREDHLQGTENFLKAANRAGVYLAQQFNTQAQSSYKRI